MLNELKNLSSLTATENGALRSAGEGEIETCFLRAYAEDPDLAMKILFYCRDIRGGP